MSILAVTYSYNPTTAEPPTGSQLRLDAAPPFETVTRVWATNSTNTGEDLHTVLMSTVVGDRLYIQDKDDHTRYVIVQVTAPPIAKGSYVELPVQWLETGAQVFTGQQTVTLYLMHTEAVVAPTVVVPSVVGVAEADATNALLAGNLTVGVRSLVTSGAVAVGAVSFQAPAAGLFVAAGTPIAISVSTGPAPAPTTPPTIATPGAPDANTYMTVEEFLAYLTTKPFVTTLPTPEQCPALLIEGTRLIDASLSGLQEDVAIARGQAVMLGWTGAVATPEQALAWPRVGMLTRHNFALPPDVIPVELKRCLGEVALALRTTDLSATDAVKAQGIASVSAGSVSVSFNSPSEKAIEPVRRLPDAAYLMLVPSWYQSAVDASSGFEFALI